MSTNCPRCGLVIPPSVSVCPWNHLGRATPTWNTWEWDPTPRRWMWLETNDTQQRALLQLQTRREKEEYRDKFYEITPDGRFPSLPGPSKGQSPLEEEEAPQAPGGLEPSASLRITAILAAEIEALRTLLDSFEARFQDIRPYLPYEGNDIRIDLEHLRDAINENFPEGLA